SDRGAAALPVENVNVPRPVTITTGPFPSIVSIVRSIAVTVVAGAAVGHQKRRMAADPRIGARPLGSSTASSVSVAMTRFASLAHHASQYASVAARAAAGPGEGS